MGKENFPKSIEEKLKAKEVKVVKSISVKLDKIDEKTLQELKHAIT